LVSVEPVHLFAGRNAAAVRNMDGDWEVLQFLNASLVSAGIYQLTGLLRGQGGSEHAMRPAVAAGAPFVLLDESIARIDLGAGEIAAPLFWRVWPACRTHAVAH